MSHLNKEQKWPRERLGAFDLFFRDKSQSDKDLAQAFGGILFLLSQGTFQLGFRD